MREEIGPGNIGSPVPDAASSAAGAATTSDVPATSPSGAGDSTSPATGWPDATALILFAHGARDPRWAEPLTRLAHIVQAQRPGVVVEPAFLELMQPDLPSVLDRLASDGHARVNLLPVFWSAGGHVLRDLPELVTASRLRHPGLNVAVLPVLSELPGVLDAVGRAAWPTA